MENINGGSIVRKFVVLIVGVALGLGGCATKYTGPRSEEPSASISFEASGDASLGYMAYLFYMDDPNKRSCMGIKPELAKINKGNPFGGKTSNLRNIPIPAGRKIAIRSVLVPANVINQRGCTVDNIFTATPGIDYLIKISWSRSQCVTDLLDITNGKEELVQIEQDKRSC